ncbi:MAG: protein-(glutamine-N5) methyltransferase [Pyrobaculum sp.]|uniref:protein-(glutamine-N5) methyltransferase n=1 Tax=Pyrobaculum sp. TaxID=2004705 RepID=UPI00317250BB
MPYQPAEDSYLTQEAVDALEGADVCLDVGTGSCILAKALRYKCRRVVAVDVDLGACKSCTPEVDVLCNDAAWGIRRADIAVFNLPYLPPEDPLDVSIHDVGVVPKFLRWISATRPRVVVLTFSSLGRADFVMDALRTMCTVIRTARLHLFFESIYTVTALCGPSL